MKDLYNRTRPRTFREMLPTSNFLKNIDDIIEATLSGKPGLPHVMIFHSNFIPGLGKTTCARILSVELNPKIKDSREADDIFNGLPSLICSEVNATDMKKPDVADLIGNMMAAREDIHGYNYVYIINEAHKLTEDSVQLLLSVEDLPDNVYVIMTTTETIKIRADLLSRIRTYTFKPASEELLLKYVLGIITKYKDEYPYSNKYDIQEDTDKLREIIRMAMGSIRRAIVLLEHYMSSGDIDNPNDANQEEKDKYKVFFHDFVKLWIDAASPEGKTGWRHIAKMFNTITMARTGRAGMPAEEFRKHVLYRIQNNLLSDSAVTDGLSIYESAAYNVLEKYLLDMLSFPALTQLTLKLHMAYMELVSNISPEGN